MVAGPRQEFTPIPGRARNSDERARGELIALIYDETDPHRASGGGGGSVRDEKSRGSSPWVRPGM